MSTEQPMQEPEDLTPAVDGASSEAAAAKPRRTRKPKVVEEGAAASDVTAEPTSAPKVARKRAAKTEVSAEAVEASLETVEVPEVAKPKRAPRKRAAPEAAEAAASPVLASIDDSALTQAPEARAEASTESTQASAELAQPSEASVDQSRPDRGPRRERSGRGERRGSRGEARQDARAGDEAASGDVGGAAASDDLPSDDEQRPSRRAAIAAEQAEAVFKELLAGEFDEIYEEEAEEEGGDAAQTKRVLRPEPDAPKLQKVLAQSGVGSRRDIEQMIEDGRISVNGEVAHIGQRVSFGDKIAIGGKPIRVRIQPPPARILAYHKPTGEVVTHEDPQNRPTVFRRLPRLQNGKWQSVGRLDLNTEGLLLFTNSGDLANQLMHPRFGVEREYAVRVLGSLNPDTKLKLLEGVEIEGQQASFKSIDEGGGEGVNRWYRVVITEGRNREVRKLFDAVGLTVSRLIRVRYGAIVLPHGLKRGVWVELGESDVRAVKSMAGGDRQEQGRGGRDDRQGAKGGQRHAQGGKHQGKDRFAGAGQGGGQPRGQAPQGQGGRGSGGQRSQFERGDRAPQDRGPNDRGDRQGFKPARDERVHDRPRDEDIDDIGPIPNPLEQTFDRRFAKGSKRITAGFGRPDQFDQQPRGGKKGGPREPDPLQTSVGYIGADAYFGKSGGGGGRGGNRSGGGGRGRR